MTHFRVLGPRDRRDGSVVVAECPVCGLWEHDLTDLIIDDEGVLRGTWMECRSCLTVSVLEPSR